MDPSDATELLIALGKGDREALRILIPLVHAELKQIARQRLKLERDDHTLDTTALVNEAYLKLFRSERLQLESRAQFLALAAQAMRNILVSYARARGRIKRGGGARPVSLSAAAGVPAAQAEQILDLNAALEALAELNPRHARFVECRFFGGMTIEETASALGISIATAKREWVLLRAWLQRELDRSS